MKRYLVISTSVDLVRAAVDEIVFVSSDGNYSTLVFTYGESRVVTRQLGQIEALMHKQLAQAENDFVRIGKSLIVNINFISYIHPGNQKLVLSDGHTASHSLTASREALKKLKDFLDKEVK